MDLFSNMSNTQAVARLKEGDEAVFTQLYESASRMVYFQARKILEDDEAAQDVVQDTFITVFRSIDKLRDPEALRSWIGGIAVRLALKKRQAILTSPELLPEGDAMFDDRPAPDAATQVFLVAVVDYPHRPSTGAHGQCRRNGFQLQLIFPAESATDVCTDHSHV